ncbi:MAG: AAA family ATPase [Proteobacteria bacterium]|jgi:hypothetical protein|nr:AAA family ATPase [Pseudomonadota bacterium]
MSKKTKPSKKTNSRRTRKATTTRRRPKSLAGSQHHGERRWLIEGLIRSEGVSVIAGPPNSYRTWLAIDLALAVKTGDTFLDHQSFSSAESEVIFVTDNVPISTMVGRAQHLAMGRELPSQGVADSIRFITGQDFLSRLPKLGGKKRSEKKVSLIVIDVEPLPMKLERHEVESMFARIGELRTLSNYYGAPIVVVGTMPDNEEAAPLLWANKSLYDTVLTIAPSGTEDLLNGSALVDDDISTIMDFALVFLTSEDSATFLSSWDIASDDLDGVDAEDAEIAASL